MTTGIAELGAGCGSVIKKMRLRLRNTGIKYRY